MPNQENQREPLTDRQEEVLSFIRDAIVLNGYPPTLREIGEKLSIRSTNGVNDHLKALERKGYLVRDDLKSRALKPVDLASDKLNPRSRGGVVPNSTGFAESNQTHDRFGRARGRQRPANEIQRGSASARFSQSSVSAQNDALIEVPLLGRVAAGRGMLLPDRMSDATDERISIDPRMLSHARNVRELFALEVRGDSMIEEGILEGDVVVVRRGSEARAGDKVVAAIDDEVTVKKYYPERDAIRLEPANHRYSSIVIHKKEARSVAILGTVIALMRRM